MFPTAAQATTVHTQRRERNATQPSRRSARNDARARRSRAGGRSIARHTALIAKVAASTAIAQPAPTATTSTPASAGPRISLPEIAAERSAFAGCSSSSGTTSGRRPVEAGLNRPVAAPVTPARAASIQISAAPLMTSTAIVPWLTIRARSAVDHHRAARGPVRDHPSRQHGEDQRRPSAGEHEPDLRLGSAEVDHGEGKGDDDHPVAEHGDALTQEEEPEVPSPQHLEVVAEPHGQRRYMGLDMTQVRSRPCAIRCASAR